MEFDVDILINGAVKCTWLKWERKKLNLWGTIFASDFQIGEVTAKEEKLYERNELYGVVPAFWFVLYCINLEIFCTPFFPNYKTSSLKGTGEMVATKIT